MVKDTLKLLLKPAELKALLHWKNNAYAPGHFYSPITNKEEVQKFAHQVFQQKDFVEGIDSQHDAQMALLGDYLAMNVEQVFPASQGAGWRYYQNNQVFNPADGLALHFFMRHFKPRRIIEVGSGFSSAVMLDTRDKFLNGDVQLQFVEPYPDRLLALLNEDDVKSGHLKQQFVQEVDLSVFQQLQAGDLLFIDSSHVSKPASDFNYLLFHVLPRLAAGTYIHFHDLHWPFEYPKEWILGWDYFGWNEIYVVRAFLMNNPDYRIVFHPSYLSHQLSKPGPTDHSPDCVFKHTVGGSLYIQKLR